MSFSGRQQSGSGPPANGSQRQGQPQPQQQPRQGQSSSPSLWKSTDPSSNVNNNVQIRTQKLQPASSTSSSGSVSKVPRVVPAPSLATTNLVAGTAAGQDDDRGRSKIKQSQVQVQVSGRGQGQGQAQVQGGSGRISHNNGMTGVGASSNPALKSGARGTQNTSTSTTMGTSMSKSGFASGNGSGSGSGSGGELSGADTPANGVSNPPRPRSTRRGLGGLTEHDVSGLAEEEVGWGLGRFGIREHEESARRLQAAGERLREGRLLGGDGDGEEDDAGDALGRRRGSRASGGGGHTPRGEASRRSSRSRQGVSAARRSSVPAVLGPVAVVHPELMTNDESIEGENGAMAGPGPSTVHRSARDRDREREGGSEWEDIDGSSGSSSDERRDRDRRPRAGAGIGSRWGRRRSRQRQDVDHAAGAIEGERKTTGWSWWGPLKEWRLADRSAF